MTTFAVKQAALDRILIDLLIPTMNYCAETFGVAPCTATGTKCYNTWPTCKDLTNYNKTTKDYKHTSEDVPVDVLGFDGVRPDLVSVTPLAAEIKNNKTVGARETYVFKEGPELFDVGLDPYRADRTTIQGDYWKKWLARNSNWKGRTITRYEGFDGIAEAQFQKRFTGKIKNIKRGKGIVTIEAVDLLSSLDDVTIPAKVDCELAADITDSQTYMYVNDASVLTDPAGGTKYVKFNDEIVSYTTRDTTTNQISGGAREQGGTTAAAHSKNDKVELVEYFAPGNPYDHARTILNSGGIADANIETATFTALKTDPIVDIDYEAWIVKPVKVRKLYFELVADHLDCKSWQNEDQKIDIAKNQHNKPDCVFHTLTTVDNIIDNSESVDLNDGAIYTRIVLYWNKTTLGDDTDRDKYSRWDIPINADAEDDNDRGVSIHAPVRGATISV